TPCILVDVVVVGLDPGLHVFHINESGDVSLGTARWRLGADESRRAKIRFVDSVLKMAKIIGRAVVVTGSADDLELGANDQSLIDGNSGERIACGIIARSAGIMKNFRCDGVSLWDERNRPLAGKERSQKL
ncbi:blast:Copper chaperone for superoxide dismutase, partial [Drosophila guanche]